MLRKLQPQTNKIIQDMAFTIDIREDIYYQQGVSDTAEKLQTEIVSNMLSNSDLTVAQIANFTNSTEDFVEKIKKSLPRKKKS